MNTTIKTPTQNQLIKLCQWRIYLKGRINLNNHQSNFIYLSVKPQIIVLVLINQILKQKGKYVIRKKKYVNMEGRLTILMGITTAISIDQ